MSNRDFPVGFFSKYCATLIYIDFDVKIVKHSRHIDPAENGDESRVQISGDLISHCHECVIYCHVVMWDCHECHTLSHSSQICINYQFDWLGHGMKPGKQIKLQNPIVLYFLIKFLNLNCTGCVATLIIPQKMWCDLPELDNYVVCPGTWGQCPVSGSPGQRESSEASDQSGTTWVSWGELNVTINESGSSASITWGSGLLRMPKQDVIMTQVQPRAKYSMFVT